MMHIMVYNDQYYEIMTKDNRFIYIYIYNPEMKVLPENPILRDMGSV